jgi:hypothetical protein
LRIDKSEFRIQKAAPCIAPHQNGMRGNLQSKICNLQSSHATGKVALKGSLNDNLPTSARSILCLCGEGMREMRLRSCFWKLDCNKTCASTLLAAGF